MTAEDEHRAIRNLFFDLTRERKAAGGEASEHWLERSREACLQARQAGMAEHEVATFEAWERITHIEPL